MVHTGDAPGAPMAPFHSNQESLSTSFPLPECHLGCQRSTCLIPEYHLPCIDERLPTHRKDDKLIEPTSTSNTLSFDRIFRRRLLAHEPSLLKGLKDRMPRVALMSRMKEWIGPALLILYLVFADP